MYKLPISSPNKPFLTLPYGSKAMVQWYKDNGLNLTEHNGADFITGKAVETYGAALVCPFPTAKVVNVVWDSPMTTKGNGVTLEYKEGNKRHQIVFWHTGEIVVKLNQVVGEGQTVCYIGNSGLCMPAPTKDRPYDGSHLHFMLFTNGVLKDPLTLFDKDEWYLGEDSGFIHDIEPAKWSWELQGITDWWMKLITALKWWS